MVTEKDITNMGRTQADILALEEKIKMEEEAREAQISNLKQGDKIPVSAPESPTGESKKIAVKIAEKAGVSPRKCYSYFEFERLHLRRSRA